MEQIPPTANRNSQKFLVILGMILAFLLGMGTMYLWQKYPEFPLLNPLNLLKPKGIACTMDAKICPDGTAVGRIPPNCDFVPCPSVTPLTTPLVSPLPSSALVPADWKTYQNAPAKVSFKYPPSWYDEPLSLASGYSALHPVVILKYKDNNPGPEPGIIQITYWDNPDNLDLKQSEAKYTNPVSGLGPHLYYSNAQKETLAGAESYFVKEADCAPVICSKHLIFYKNRIYDFTIFIRTRTPLENTIIDQILSTFKFTD